VAGGRRRRGRVQQVGALQRSAAARYGPRRARRAHGALAERRVRRRGTRPIHGPSGVRPRGEQSRGDRLHSRARRRAVLACGLVELGRGLGSRHLQMSRGGGDV